MLFFAFFGENKFFRNVQQLRKFLKYVYIKIKVYIKKNVLFHSLSSILTKHFLTQKILKKKTKEKVNKFPSLGMLLKNESL
jgi:hypothetical protein